jgi:proline iminopeptidase
MEYALAHQDQLKGLVVSNMMSSIPAYNDYAASVLIPVMDHDKVAEIRALEAAGDTDHPRYMELLIEQHYVHHVLRMPPDEWPDPVNRAFEHVNQELYTAMQGPSELGASGKLAEWDRTDDLVRITVPTLVMGAGHDTMDPDFLRSMAESMPNGRYHHSPAGSHLAMYDDQETYFAGLISFLADVDSGDQRPGAVRTRG